MNKARIATSVALFIALVGICHAVARFWVMELKHEWLQDVTFWNLGEVPTQEWVGGHVLGLLFIAGLIAIIALSVRPLKVVSN